MKIIDPHLHLFNLEQGDYQWLKAENPPTWPDKSLINKTFTENDLILENNLSLSAFVHIEAGFDNDQPWLELEALEYSCNKPFSAIANIDLTLTSKKFNECMAKLSHLTSFVGVRHILDEQSLTTLTNKQVLDNFAALNYIAKNEKRTLVFEAQLPLTEHIPVNKLCEVIHDNPNLTFIINHAGFPPLDIQTIEWQRWQSNLLKLTAYPHVKIKCSGWEMIDRNYSQTWLNKNLNLIFKLFGKDNMMLASNFPLCLLSNASYQSYWQSIINSEFFQALSTHEKSALCYDNALRVYSIKL